MKLRRLEILGFKSFAEPVELGFTDGITSVVGPNGCGKSNVADALRWVLGNTNPRQLRVDRMEDVIFSGSSGRKPMGMAEVTAVFDNEDGTLPVEYAEVAVTRRFFRSGEGEFLLNGGRCRLMDITDLIADVGLASNGYWILESDMVKTLLSPRPEDRRFLFDEAAGIVRYKIQRHRAELKLSAAAADLERLEDILAEVRRNTDALKKQAALLSRYEKAATTAASIEALLASRERARIETDLSGLGREMARASSEEQDSSAELAAVSARHSAARTELERSQQALDLAHSSCSAIEKGLSDCEKGMAVISERLKGLEGIRDDLLRRSEASARRAEASGKSAAEAAAQRDALSAALKEHRAVLKTAGKVSDEAEARLADARRRMEAAKATAAAAALSIEKIRRRIDDSRAARTALEMEMARAAASRDLLTVKKAEASAGLSEAASALDSLVAGAASAAAERDTAAADASAASGRLDLARAAETRAETELKALREKVESLSAAIPAEGSGDALSTLLEPRKGFGKALGAFLDAFQEAVVADAPCGGEGGLRLACAVPASESSVPEGAVRLSDSVKSCPDSLSGLLSHGLVAPDRATALRWLASGSSHVIVTREGDLFRPEGLVRLGIPSGSAGTVEMKAMIEEATAALALCGAGLESLRKARLEAESCFADASARQRALEDGLASVEKRKSAAQATVESFTRSLQALGGEISGLERALPDIERKLSECGSGAEGGGLEEAAAEEKRLRAEADSASEQASLCQQEASAKLRARDEAENGSKLLQARLEAAEEAERQHGSAASQASEEAAALKSGAVAEAARIEELKTSEQGEKLRLDALKDELEAAHAARSEAAAARAARFDEANTLETRLGSLREKLAGLREEKGRIAALVAVAEEKLKAPFDPEALPAEGSRLSRLDESQLASELVRVKAERENLGPVNMLASSEYSEALGRLEFLEAQRLDLVKARQSLLQAISEINATAAARFAETFESVRTNFRSMFSRLFEGGEADIQFIESEDPLEGGVSISARPRGKKLETLSALSGGERAMTAVALLFALYLVKPSPFCVLDELDAPLDDANVDRFIELLGSFSASTQFIIITHNRRTMEAADRLFGITMAEEGVSSQISVSLAGLPEGGA